MSLLRRIESGGHAARLLRRLLEKLEADQALLPQVEALLAQEEDIELSEEDRQHLAEKPVDFLLGTRPPQPRGRVVPQGAPRSKPPDALVELKALVSSRLLAEVEPGKDLAGIRAQIEQIFNEAVAELPEGITLSRTEQSRLFDSIIAGTIGFGPLEPLLADETIHEIRVLGYKQVFITRQGRRERTSITFDNEEYLLRVIDRMIAPLGKRIDESQPMLAVRMPDGSRVTVVIRPTSLGGPVVTIHKFNKMPLTADDLERFGTITPDALALLQAAVQAGLNIVVSGAESTGKTTLLNTLCGFIPDYSLIVVIGDYAELTPQQQEVALLQTRPPNIEGRGEVTLRQLVSHALRMYPGHIVVEELKAGEVYELIQGGTTWLATLPSSSPYNTITRLRALYQMGAGDVPATVVSQWVAEGVDLVVHMSRMGGGSRKVTHIAQTAGMEADGVVLIELMRFEQTSSEAGRIFGNLRRTEHQPSTGLLERLTSYPVDEPLRQRIRDLFAGD